MTITQLHYFQAICQHDSVTQAARSLHISQPALSNSIKDLENEFGLNLFHRQNKRFIITKEGEYFLSRASDILESYNEMLFNMKSFAAARNDIKIGMQTFVSTVIAPQLMTDFHKKYPEIKFDIQELPSNDIAQQILSGLLDVGFVNLPTINETPFDVYELYSIPMYFCVHKDSPLAKYNELELKDIADYPLVMVTNGRFDSNGIIAAFKRANITPNILLFTGQYSAVAEYIRLGGAGGFLCKEHIQAYSNDIVQISVKGIPSHRIGLIAKRINHIYADTAKFINFVQDWIFEHPEIGGLIK